MTIEEKYQQACARESDISQHLPTLYKYAKECDHITEMGVRNVVSTWAFLNAIPALMFSYDKEPTQNIEQVYELTAGSLIDFRYIVRDVLEIEIEPTELLFIDTWHTYGQLKQELALHANKVSKYIILHDTETFGQVGEGGEDRGLQPAIDEFLAGNEKWYVREVFKNNNGLTVLAKYEH